MKKKVKLITTIASLCLAVALMAFGVYAATTATLGITSQVSFTASNVYVQFDAEVAYGANVTYTADSNPGETYTPNAQERKNTWNTTVNPQTNAGATSSTTWNLGVYAFQETAEGQTVVYTFKITNKGSNPVAITVTTEVGAVTTGEAGTIAVATSVSEGGGTANRLNKDAVYTYTVTVTLNDATMDWGEKDINPAFSVAKA